VDEKQFELARGYEKLSSLLGAFWAHERLTDRGTLASGSFRHARGAASGLSGFGLGTSRFRAGFVIASLNSNGETNH